MGFKHSHLILARLGKRRCSKCTQLLKQAVSNTRFRKAM
jgi:hypothetical protein